MDISVASFAITCALCFGIFWISVWHFRRRRFYKLAAKFQGPPTLPLIGNAHLLMGDAEHIMQKITELTSLYPSPSKLWIGPQLWIYIDDPNQIKVICNCRKSLDKGDILDFCRPFLGTGLFTAPASIWKVHRKLIQPAFNTKILETFVEIFSTQSKIFTERIEVNLNGPEFEIHDPIIRCTTDMICETAMGVKIGAQTDRNSDYLEAQKTTMGAACQRLITIWLQPDFIFYRTQLGKRFRKHVKSLLDFTDNVIQARRNELCKPSNPRDPADHEDDPCAPMSGKEAFLDHLMKLSNDGVKLSDEELRDEVQTMVIAGNESNAFAVSCAFLMLASHQDVQDKVYEELFEIYGNADIADRPVVPEDLPRLKYLERVIKETLRLFPPGPYASRRMEEDLDIGHHILPKGSMVAIAIIGLHRNGKYWPDPLKFDPDRFSPEGISKRHPYAFLPFSTGPRNCPGSTYAMMSMKTLLATTLRKYILKTDSVLSISDLSFKVEIVMKSAIPIKIRIERRVRS